jgi:hypothetical protein
MSATNYPPFFSSFPAARCAWNGYTIRPDLILYACAGTTFLETEVEEITL